MRDRISSALARPSFGRICVSSPHVQAQVVESWWPCSLARVVVTAGALLSVSPYALASPEPNSPVREPTPAGIQSAPPRLSPQEVETVLPLFLKFSETRALAAALEGSIQQGDIVAARGLIEKAVEASTFAILASDWLQDPALVRMLHARGIHKATASVPDSAAEIDELKKALEAERERKEFLEREHAAMTERLAATQASQDRNAAAAAEAGSLRETLERERERSQRLASDKAATAEKLAVLESELARDAAEMERLRGALDLERERSYSLARDHAAANEALAALQARQDRHAAALAEVSELRRALEIEQERSMELARDHATLTLKLAGVQFTHSIGNPSSTETPAGRENRVAARAAAPATSPPDLTIVPALPANPLVTRAETLFRSGDVSGARLLLERASEAGDPAAMFLLAETFDPRALSRLGVIGVRGDGQKAEELYARARALRSGPESVQAGAAP